jgi:heptosyltransferase-2
VNIQGSNIRNILALIPNWVGDVAMCTPALRALHNRFPEARFTVAGRSAGCDLLEGLPWITDFWRLPARPGVSGIISHGWRLKPQATDLAVIFPHSFRSALIALIAGARWRVGYDRDARPMLLTHRLAPNRVNGVIQPIYMVDEYMKLAEAVGAQDDGLGLELKASPQALSEVDAVLGSDGGPLIGFAPGAAFGPSKMWPTERFAQVADAATEKYNARCVLFCGPGEEETKARILAVSKLAKFIDYAADKPSIDRLKAGISRMSLLVCNDSGPRHIAIAFGVPVVCIMGPTKPEYTNSPYERGKVLRVDVPCGPCQKPVCTTDHACMTRITPECVMKTVSQVLG